VAGAGGGGIVITGNILVIDDDESIRLGCQQALQEGGHRVRLAENGPAGLRLAAEESFDVALLDLRMPGPSGLEVLEKLKENDPDLVVIVITGYATVESAVEGMRRGAWDYLPKPFEPDLLLKVVERALERKRLSMENAWLRLALRQRGDDDAMVGEGPAMTEVYRLVQKVAPTDATVLILGDTGTGKELAARAIHRQSSRRDKPFVTVDCAALVESLFESELFGHVRGAYTGAYESTTGKLEMANGGTVFLDEVGNIAPGLQVKLLRVLQEREFMKVGSTRRVKLDVRVVAATNNDLLSDIEQGGFRQDLFFRLSVVPIRLPALRERVEDVRPLAAHFLQLYRVRRKRNVTGFSEEALRALESYPWPGNVRELENTVERAVVMADGPTIERGDLFFYGQHEAVRATGTPSPGATPTIAASAPVALDAEPLDKAERQGEGHLARMERCEIAAVLDRFDWQMARAADYLGINRKTLREKIRRYGLTR
jgi:DNA-binding NtrC family response regulator